jgi:hypothetical protein
VVPCNKAGVPVCVFVVVVSNQDRDVCHVQLQPLQLCSVNSFCQCLVTAQQASDAKTCCVNHQAVYAHVPLKKRQVEGLVLAALWQ